MAQGACHVWRWIAKPLDDVWVNMWCNFTVIPSALCVSTVNPQNSISFVVEKLKTIFDWHESLKPWRINICLNDNEEKIGGHIVEERKGPIKPLF